MSFVYPGFLWALTALSIPIIVHLFNFRKTIRVYFSNTRFLKQVKEETTQKRKLKQYLVLASRLLFLFFLIMAFAQPFLPATEQSAPGKNKTIYLDNSFSMTVPMEEKLRGIDAATLFAQQITEVFPPDTRYRLITNDFAPFSNSYKTKTELQDLLAQMRLSPISRTANEINSRLGGMDDEVFWISDFQKSTWGDDGGFDSSRQVHLVPLDVANTSNVFVDSLYLDNPFVVGGERNAIRVKLRNNGQRRLEGLVVKLTINGVQAGTVSTDLESQSSAEVSFDISAGLSGLNSGMISFNDFPVSFDNEFYFTINFSKPVRVVEVKASSEASFVEKVFGNRQLFTFQSYSSGNVDYGVLTQADLVVINGVNRLDPAMATTLQTYRQNGGTVLLAPGTQPDVASYMTALALPNLAWQAQAVTEDLEKPDYNKPLFENIFEERSAQLAMPKASRSLTWGPDPSAILKFKTGEPFLSQKGRLYLLSSPLSRDYTDFYNHALFVPVMYRLAALGRRSESKPYYFLEESVITIPADSLYGEEPVRLVGTQELIPPQRKEVDRVVMELPKFAMTAGFYQVRFQQDTLDQVAFNMAREESVMDRFSVDELESQYGSGNVSVFSTSSPSAFGNEIKDRYLGTPLWKHALILALVFLLAEVLLIRFWK